MIQVDLKSPGECSANEIRDFVDLVMQVGEVAAGGLRERVMVAELLVFLSADGYLVGVAAIKNPNDMYRSRVALASGYELTKQLFPY